MALYAVCARCWRVRSTEAVRRRAERALCVSCGAEIEWSTDRGEGYRASPESVRTALDQIDERELGGEA